MTAMKPDTGSAMSYTAMRNGPILKKNRTNLDTFAWYTGRLVIGRLLARKHAEYAETHLRSDAMSAMRPKCGPKRKSNYLR
jgi:hypothetical protein